MAASAARTATANLTAVRLARPINGFVFIYDYTVNATLAGDTCDVYIQTKLDGVTGAASGNWTDVVHFPQVLGTAAAGRRHAKILNAGVLLEGDNTAALAAGQVRHAIGDDWRVRVVIAGGNPSFTFSVTAMPM
jgi:hypothetical protein